MRVSWKTDCLAIHVRQTSSLKKALGGLVNMFYAKAASLPVEVGVMHLPKRLGLTSFNLHFAVGIIYFGEVPIIETNPTSHPHLQRRNISGCP